MKALTKQDYKRINEYFEESGRVYNESDVMVYTESIDEMAQYLFETDSKFMIELMARITDIQEGDNMLETLISEVSYVWYDYENGKYYVIVQ